MKQLLTTLCAALFVTQSLAQKLYQLEYQLDTIRYKQQIVLKQRYNIDELINIMAGNGDENTINMIIQKLQTRLDELNPTLTGKEPTADIAVAEYYINEVTDNNLYHNFSFRTDEDYRVFNITNYRSELDLYKLAIKDNYPGYQSPKKEKFDKERLEKLERRYKHMAYNKEIVNKQLNKEITTAYQKVNNARTSDELNKAIDTFYAINFKVYLKEGKEQCIRDSMKSIENDIENKKYFAGLKKKYGAVAYDKAMNGTLWVGMPAELAKWAAPSADDIRISETTQGRTIIWIFYNQGVRSVMLRNGKVISITY